MTSQEWRQSWFEAFPKDWHSRVASKGESIQTADVLINGRAIFLCAEPPIPEQVREAKLIWGPFDVLWILDARKWPVRLRDRGEYVAFIETASSSEVRRAAACGTFQLWDLGEEVPGDHVGDSALFQPRKFRFDRNLVGGWGREYLRSEVEAHLTSAAPLYALEKRRLRRRFPRPK